MTCRSLGVIFEKLGHAVIQSDRIICTAIGSASMMKKFISSGIDERVPLLFDIY